MNSRLAARTFFLLFLCSGLFFAASTTLAQTARPSISCGQLGLVPSNTVWNATAKYTVERLRSTLFVTAKNVFDCLYIADRSRGILPGLPRLVQAGLKYRF